MKKIEITEENYKEYEKLFNKRTTWDIKDELIELVVLIFIVAITMGIAEIVFPFTEEILSMYSFDACFAIGALTFVTYTSIVGGLLITLPNIIHKKRINNQFSNLNTKIKTEELRDRLRQFNESKKYNKIKNQDLIKKYEQIKEEMLEEYRKDYSSLKYNTSISEEELEKTKEKVKRLAK